MSLRVARAASLLKKLHRIEQQLSRRRKGRGCAFAANPTPGLAESGAAGGKRKRGRPRKPGRPRLSRRRGGLAMYDSGSGGASSGGTIQMYDSGSGGRRKRIGRPRKRRGSALSGGLETGGLDSGGRTHRRSRAVGRPRRRGAARGNINNLRPWLMHVAQYRRSHPNLSYKEVLQRARSSYKS